MNDILRIFTIGGAAAVMAAPPYVLPGLAIIAFGASVTGLIAFARPAQTFNVGSAARRRTHHC